MREKPFTRPTIVAANELLAQAARTHTEINKLVLRLGLEAEIPDDTSLGIEKKCDRLGRTVLSRPEDVVASVDGSFTLAEAFVRQALTFARQGSEDPRQDAFLRGLSRDGYVVVWGESGQRPSLRIALPNEVDLPATDDEVRSLLKHFQFSVAHGHLDQAIEAHTRGEWAAANAQLRTFLEGLFDDIARYVDLCRAARCRHRKIVAQCLLSLESGFLPRTATNGHRMARITSTVCSRCCTQMAPIRACPTRTTAPSVCTLCW